MNQPCRGICQTESCSAGALAWAPRRRAHSVVEHLDLERIAYVARRDPYVSRCRAWADSMTNCILDEWLQQETWHQRTSGVVADVELNIQLVLKSHALNPDITLEQLQLALEMYFVLHGA